MKKFEIYTDGACSGNPGRGGWSAIAFNEDGDNIMQQSGGYRLTTNNRMEILAVAEGLRRLREQCRDTDIKVTVYSDSQLVVNTMTLGWSRKTNSDLWKQLDESLELYNGGVITFIKVKGHSTNPKNDLADQVAVAASQPINAVQVDSYYEGIAKGAGICQEGEPVIKEVRLVGFDTPDKREVKINLSNGTTVSILPLYGGFQQTGCTQAEAAVTVDIANRFCGWLNGKKL